MSNAETKVFISIQLFSQISGGMDHSTSTKAHKVFTFCRIIGNLDEYAHDNKRGSQPSSF